MSPNTEQARFLGLNWHVLWKAFLEPWAQAHRWPVVVALTPPALVRLVHLDGRESLWNVGAEGEMRQQTASRRSQFLAIELSEDTVLRRKLFLPALGSADIEQAVALDVQSNSPFAIDDLRWGYRVTEVMASDGLRVDAVMGSHRQISAHMRARTENTQDAASSPEVWVRQGVAEKYIILNGFGESRRIQSSATKRRLGFGLVGVIGILIGLIAITPTLQLRLRAIEAVNAYTAVFHRAAPVVREREALVRSADQLQILRATVQEKMDPIVVLDLLTRVLNDDTSLRSLKIQGRKIYIEGQTGNAAELMQLLGQQPQIRDVVAPTAATRPFGAIKDNFKLEFNLISQPVPEASPPSQTLAPAGGRQTPASAPHAMVVPVTAPGAML